MTPAHSGCATREQTQDYLYRRAGQDVKTVPEPTFEFHGVW